MNFGLRSVAKIRIMVDGNREQDFIVCFNPELFSIREEYKCRKF